MDAGLLDVLHDAAEVELGAVVERIDVDLDGVLEEPVDQHRVLGADVGRLGDVGLERGVVVDDLHAAPAEHVGGPDQHRVTDAVGDLPRLGERRRGAVLGGGQAGVGSTRPNAPRCSARSIASGEVPRTGTPASLSRCARPSGVWPPSVQMTPATGPAARSASHHLEDVLEGQRLEVEPVGGVVVGGDRLGVAVDHHRLVAGVLQRHDGVHAGVVELDALPDPVRARAEDQHRPASRCGGTSVSSS